MIIKLRKYNLSNIDKTTNNIVYYNFGSSFSYYDLTIQKFFTNSDYNGLFIGGNIYFYFDMSLNMNILNGYSFGSSTNFKLPKIITTTKATYIVAINSLDANNYCRYIKVGSDGTINKYTSIGVTLTKIYDAVINPSNSFIEIAGEDSEILITYIIRYDPNSDSYSRLDGSSPYYSNFVRIYDNKINIELYNVYSSTPNIVYLHARESLISDSFSECILYSYLLAVTNASSVSQTIPSVSTITKSGTSVSYSGSAGLISIFNFYTISYLSSCSSYGITQAYRASTNPIKFGYSSYANISIGALFCKLSGTFSIEFDISSPSSETKDISWIGLSPPSYYLQGLSPFLGVNYNITVAIRVNDVIIQYPFSLLIYSCSDSHCKLCLNNSTCQECQSGYNLDSSKTECIASLAGVNAATAGIISSSVTTSVVAVSVVAINQCNPQTSLQNIFTISEYYQLLISTLILNVDISDLVYDFLNSYKIFKFDFSEINEMIFKSNSFHISSSDLNQSNSKLERLGYKYNSAILNFLNTAILILLISIIHIFVYILFTFCKLFKEINEHHTQIHSNSKYKPKCWIRIISSAWQFFNRNFYITSFFEVYLFLLINCASEFMNISGNSIISWISLSISLLIVLFQVCLTSYFIYFIIKCDVSKQITGSNSCLFKGLKITKISSEDKFSNNCKIYNIIFLLRRSIIALCLTCIRNRYFQFAVFSAANCMHFGYISLIRPFINTADNIIFAITDFSIILVGLVYCLFITNEDTRSFSQSEINQYGAIICWIVLSTNICLSIIVFSQFITQIIIKIKRKCFNIKRDTKVYSKSTQDLTKTTSQNEITSIPLNNIERFHKHKALVEMSSMRPMSIYTSSFARDNRIANSSPIVQS